MITVEYNFYGALILHDKRPLGWLCSTVDGDYVLNLTGQNPEKFKTFQLALDWVKEMVAE